MKKRKSNSLKFAKFKKKFSLIFSNQKLVNMFNKHLDNNGSFAGYILAVINNCLSNIKTQKIINQYCDELIAFFVELYSNISIKKSFEVLQYNPVISFELIQEKFRCFEQPINQLIEFLKSKNITLNIGFNNLHELLLDGLGYLLYNKVNCKLPYDIDDLVSDLDFDAKYTIILNNLKLFSIVKEKILNVFGNNVNDLLVLMSGMVKKLAKEK